MRGTFLKAAGAAHTGQSHRADGRPCQDAIQVMEAGTLAGICLSDGAGSASHSQFGARRAVQAATDFIVERFDALFHAPGAGVPEILAAVLEAIHQEAQALGVPPNQLACTLSFAFATATRKSVRYLCGNLGDGLVVLRTGDQLSVLLAPENREFANQTWFTTSAEAADHLRLVAGTLPVARIPGWVVTTDGAAPLLHSRRSQSFAPAVMSLLEDLRTQKLARLQQSLDRLLRDVLVPLSHDDCSLAVLQTVARGHGIRRAAR